MIDWTGFTWGGAAEIFFVTLGAVLGLGVLALGVIWAITGLYHLVMWIAENLQDWWEERQRSKEYSRRKFIRADTGEVVERHISLSKDAGRIVDTVRKDPNAFVVAPSEVKDAEAVMQEVQKRLKLDEPKRHEVVARFYGQEFADSLEGVEVQKRIDERKTDRAKKGGKLLGSVNEHKHSWVFTKSWTWDLNVICPKLYGAIMYTFRCTCGELHHISAKEFWGSPKKRLDK